MPAQTEAQQIQLDAKGLYTNPNDLSKVPPGSLLVATNTVIDRDGILEQRRGFKVTGTSIAAYQPIDSGFIFQNTLLWHGNSKFIYDSDGSQTWTAYSGTSGIPTDAFAVHATQAQKNIYFTTSKGIQKLASVTGSLVAAGIPAGLDGSGSTTGGSGWFSNNTQVAYRVVFGYIDVNNNLLLGSPTERIIVANSSGGTANVSLTFTVPGGLSTSYFYQIYRSPMSADLNTPPTDECQLVIQANLTGGQIAAGSVTVTDSVAASLKGATIYTATSQQGITQANDQPPIAIDICTFKGFTLYLGTTSKHQLALTMIATGSNGDTITIAGTTYTGQATENAAIGQYKVFTGGTVASNIDSTARSLVHVINTFSSNTLVYAYYVSGFNDLPGQIVIKEQGIGAGSFSLSVSNSPSWFYQSATSTNNNFSARVGISKFKQPEAVPALSFIDVGSADKKGFRILPLRNSVFIFKQDGVFRLTGDDLASFAVTPWDSTVILRSPEAAVLLNNQIYCFTTQGIIAVSETGSAIISRPVEKDLLQISASQFTTFDSVTFGLGYESDRKYFLNTVSLTTDTASTQSFVYNYITNTHTKWKFPKTITAGVLNTADNKLYVASSDGAFPYIYQERKSFTINDYADEEFAVTITGSSGTSVTLTSTVNLLAGDTLSQSGLSSIIVTVVDATHLTMTDSLAWNNAAATVYRPTAVTVQFTPIHGGNPTVTKLFQELLFYFSIPNFNTVTIAVSSNFAQSNTIQNMSLSPLKSGAYGQGNYGQGAYGGGNGDIQPIRTWVPLDKMRAHWINVTLAKTQALTAFALNGISVFVKTIGYRMR